MTEQTNSQTTKADSTKSFHRNKNRDRGRFSHRKGKRSSSSEGGQKKEFREFAPLSAEFQAILSSSLSDATYIVFDIETTGGNPERNGITEISALRYKNGEVVDKFYSMVNPLVPIPPIVRKMTGITNKMVKDAPLIEHVMPQFVEFIGHDILVSHNTIGDLKFLVYFAKKAANHSLENFFLCTHLLTEKLIKESPDKSLKGLAQFLKFNIGNIHRAEDDALITLDLFKELCVRLAAKNFKKVSEAIRLQGDMESGIRLGWGVDAKSLTKIPNSVGIYKLYDIHGQALFVGSTFNLNQEIKKIEHYKSLPKPLLRMVLRTYDIKWQEYPNIYEAMLAEADYHSKHDFHFSSHQWHLRSPLMLLLEKNATHLTLTIGRVKENTLMAFGLVRDRKLVFEMLQSVGLAFGIDDISQKHGLNIPLEFEKIVVAFLNNNLAELKNEYQKDKDSWLNAIFYRQKKKQATSFYEKISRLEHIEIIKQFKNMIDQNGILVTQSSNKQQHLYLLQNGIPVKDVMVQDWRNWYVTSKKAKVFQEQLKRYTSSASQMKPLSMLEAEIVNASIWMLHINKGRGSLCHYFDEKELAEISEGKG